VGREGICPFHCHFVCRNETVVGCLAPGRQLFGPMTTFCDWKVTGGRMEESCTKTGREGSYIAAPLKSPNTELGVQLSMPRSCAMNMSIHVVVGPARLPISSITAKRRGKGKAAERMGEGKRESDSALGHWHRATFARDCDCSPAAVRDAPTPRIRNT